MASPAAKLEALCAPTGLRLARAHADFVKAVLCRMDDPAWPHAAHVPLLKAMFGPNHATSITWRPLWALAAIVLTDPTVDRPSVCVGLETPRLCVHWFKGLVDLLTCIPDMTMLMLDMRGTAGRWRYHGRDLVVQCLAAGDPDAASNLRGLALPHLLLWHDAAPTRPQFLPLWQDAAHCVTFSYVDRAPTFTKAELGERDDGDAGTAAN
jgi:hypothetical protein